MKYILILSQLLLVLSAKADFLDPEIDYHIMYRQLEYKLVDPQGDLSLTRRIEQYPAILYHTLFDNKEKLAKLNEARFDNTDFYRDEFKYNEDFVMERRYRERNINYKMYNNVVDVDALVKEVDALRISNSDKEKELAHRINDRLVIEGQNRPISRTRLVQGLQQVILEEYKNGITPKQGEIHKWSDEFIKEYGRAHIATARSKLLVCLASGKTYIYMRTDKEETLLRELLAQDDNSISLTDLFRMSYRINNGDVYLTLLTIENMMSIHWKTPNRMNLDFVFPLRQITNRYLGRGDRFGSWYHFFGMILYGYAKGTVKSFIVGNVESVGSHILGEGDERQEDWINYIGGPVGGSLADIVKDKTYLEAEDRPEYTHESHYLKIGEDFRDRIAFYNTPGLDLRISKLDIGNDNPRIRTHLHLTSKEKSLYNCKIEVLPSYFNAKFKNKSKKVFEQMNLIKGEKLKLYWGTKSGRFRQLENVRVIISSCSNDSEEKWLTTERLDHFK